MYGCLQADMILARQSKNQKPENTMQSQLPQCNGKSILRNLATTLAVLKLIISWPAGRLVALR
jgi:hypothetical protein